MAGVDILSTAFSGANTAYLAELYARWVADPNSVDPSFASLFQELHEEGTEIVHDAEGASWARARISSPAMNRLLCPMARRRALRRRA